MGTRIWRIGTRRAYAYVEGRERAEKALEAAGISAPSLKRAPAPEAQMLGAMGVYLDARGRPFAWQIAFDPARWEAVVAVVSA